MLSPRAEKNCFQAKARRTGRQMWASDGPRVHDGKVYVPSPSYKPEAVAFWKSKGFRFERASYSGEHEWVRPIACPLDGKMYSAAAWLTACRKKYFEFYPEWQMEDAD